MNSPPICAVLLLASLLIPTASSQEEQNEMISQMTECVSNVNQDLPKVCDLTPYRSITGVCNNRKKTNLGASNTGFTRFLMPEYEDKNSLPRGWTADLPINGFTLPLAHDVSNEVAKISKRSIIEDSRIGRMVIQFGQFVEHDITFSPPTPTSSFLEDVDCNRCVKTHPCFPIMFSPSDPRYINGTECIPFIRSASVCSQTNPVREQVNMQTSYLDGSQIYGSDNNLANLLRNNTNQLGLLAVNQNFSDHGFAFLPFDENATDQCSMVDPSVKGPCFTAGDSRVNKQPMLTALHTLFMREHNRLVTELHELNPNWTGEKLYQEARKIMGAVLQKVTYKDWLPRMLGNEISKELPPYTSYDEDVNPAVANVFPIAFRTGHISNLLAEDYSPTNETSVTPWSTVKDGIDPVLRDSLLNKVRQNLLVNGIRTDLMSFIIQRGRDHGIPGYNDWRRFCGLSAPNNLDELADVLMNRELAEKLINLYGTVENIDMSVGGISEPPVANGRIGKSLTCLFGKQFRRLRDGDSYYYEHSSVFSSAQRRSIESVTLAQIICANTNIKKVPPNVFMANDYSDFMECSNFPVMDLTPWKA